MYKVLALDLDGTVLSNDHTINPEVKKAIIEAKAHSHVMIVTGRHHTAAKPYYQELGLTTPIICCNGTYIYDFHHNKVMEENSISKSDAITFMELANQFQMKVVLYVTDAMTYSSKNPIAYMEALEKWAQQYDEASRPKIIKTDSFKEMIEQSEYVWKFVVEGQPSSIERLSQHPWVAERFSGERSWSNRVDFSAKGNSKGKRLSDYVRALGYDANHVIAVGDNHNDISMIEYAGLGVAMLNAEDAVKACAKLISATDNNSDGIARLIREKLKG